MVRTFALTKHILPSKKAALLITIVKAGFYNFVTDPLANSRRYILPRRARLNVQWSGLSASMTVVSFQNITSVQDRHRTQLAL